LWGSRLTGTIQSVSECGTHRSPKPRKLEGAAAWVALVKDLGEAANTWTRVCSRVVLLAWVMVRGDDLVALAKLLVR
jgi:hypothetical protein